MKFSNAFKIIISLFIYISFAEYSFAQTYKQGAEDAMQPLNKSVLTTNILYDRVFPLAHLQDFTGLSGADTTNTEHFHQAYYELHNSMTNTTGFTTPRKSQYLSKE